MAGLKIIILGLLACGVDPAVTFARGQDALGAFDRELAVHPSVTRAAFHPDGDVVLLVPFCQGDPPQQVDDDVVFADAMAMCLLADGRIALVNGDGITVGTPGASDNRTIKGPEQEPLEYVRAIQPHGDGFLIVEPYAHRVRSLGPDGTERLRIGGKGRDDGQFNFPVDAAVDSQGRIFVVDRDNHRIQRFSPEGEYERAWGGRGAFPGLLAAPSSIDIENDRVYVSEQLNHRISVFDLDGRYLYQWGMHAVVPRQGEGRIHYPASVDVAADGRRAVVTEPFERRIQFFKLFPGGITEARAQPMPSKQDIRSHFGPFLAADDDLLAMWEPESGSIAVFDMRGDTGINITVFTNHGAGWDDLGRLGALHVDADTQEIIVADPVNDRLSRWRLDRDPEAPLKFDPFMARLASAVDLARTQAKLQALEPGRTWVTPRIVALARADSPEAPLLAADEANGVILALNRQLDPIRVGASTTAPLALVAEGADVHLLEASEGGLVSRWLDAEGVADGRSMMLATDGPLGGALRHEGAYYISDSAGDQILVFEADASDGVDAASHAAEAVRTWGATGDYDGALYAPAGMGRIKGDRIVIVDSGNHRAQIFAPDGTWLSTFSLSSGYTTPRRKASDG